MKKEFICYICGKREKRGEIRAFYEIEEGIKVEICSECFIMLMETLKRVKYKGLWVMRNW